MGLTTLFTPLFGLVVVPDPPAEGAATVFTGKVLSDSGTFIGNTLVLRRSETGDMAYDVPVVTVSVIDESGAAFNPTVTVVPSSGPALAYVLQAFLSEAAAGAYEAVWNFQAGGQTLLRREFHYAFWTDVREQVRRLLRVDALNMTDRDVDIAARSVLADMLGVGGILENALPLYSGLAAADRSMFDQALALCVASWIRPFTPKQGAWTELVGLAIGPDEWKWAPPLKPPNQPGIEDAWLNMAWDILSSMASFNGAFSWQNAGKTFATAGRRRNTQAPLTITRFGVCVNPLFDKWGDWLLSGRGAGWSWGSRR